MKSSWTSLLSYKWTHGIMYLERSLEAVLLSLLLIHQCWQCNLQTTNPCSPEWVTYMYAHNMSSRIATFKSVLCQYYMSHHSAVCSDSWHAWLFSISRSYLIIYWSKADGKCMSPLLCRSNQLLQNMSMLCTGIWCASYSVDPLSRWVACPSH